jgi:hypothetical protein
MGNLIPCLPSNTWGLFVITFTCPYSLSTTPLFFVFSVHSVHAVVKTLMQLKALDDLIPDQKTSGMTGFGTVSYLLLFLASIS